MLLEIACFNISSAIAAAGAGANRIELCDNPQEGGTTPSYGSIRLALEKISIPVFPIIRPRGGDFLYDKAEFAAMLYDVEQCRKMGCQGVVLGLLQANGNIDVPRTTELVQAAGSMEVTFHRAFDRAANPQQALEAVIATGCQRLLTSGQRATAPEGILLLQQLVQQAANRLCIMPGSGVRSSNLQELCTFIGATEYHSSARTIIRSAMMPSNHYWQEDNRTIGVDTNEVQRMRQVLNGM